MNRVRRGKDFKVLWSFFDYNGEPYQLDKTFLTLYVSNSFDRFEVTDFSVEENTITWIFRGKDQKALGDYTLELIQNNGTEGMIPIDSVDAFTLVQYSRDESLCGGGNVKIEDVTVNSTLDIETISSLIDAQLSEISVNPVQNKVITAALNNKADKSSVPTKTSQLTNDSGFITAEEVPAPDWNASTYKEGHIKNRTHHMQDYMCHYFNGSPIKISKPSDVGYVLLTYDTDLPEKFIRIEIKANESKTEEFLDSMGMPLIFTWDAGNSTINVQSFGGAIETYGMRAYYSSSAKGYDEYFVALDEGFIPEKVARKSELKTINGQSLIGEGNIEIKGGEGSSTFVTDFTVNDLYELVYRGAHPVQANIVALQRALENKERIVVPYGTEEYKGYSILQGYYEDLVYFTVADENGSTYVVEVGYDAGEIDRDNVTHVSPKENKINIADLQQKNVQTDAKLTELSQEIDTFFPLEGNLYTGEMVEAYIHSELGDLTPLATARTSVPIPVISGKVYCISGRKSDTASIRCIDSEGKPLKVLSAKTREQYDFNWYLPNLDATNQSFNGQFAVPEGAVAVQFAITFAATSYSNEIVLEYVGDEYSADFVPSSFDGYDNVAKRLGVKYIPSELTQEIHDIQEKVAEIEDAVFVSKTLDLQGKNNYAYTMVVGSAPVGAARADYIAFVAEGLKKGDIIIPKTQSGSSVNSYAKVKEGIIIEVGAKSVALNSPIECDGSFDAFYINNYTGYVFTPSCQLVKKVPISDVIEQKSIKILCFGNSFTQDSMSYVPFILKNIAPNLDVTIGIAYIGGCPLAQHCANLTGESVTSGGTTYTPTTYTLYIYKNGADSWNSKASQSADALLALEEWDVITFQQAGSYAAQSWETYYAPFIYKIHKAIFDKVKNSVKLGWLSIHGAYGNNVESLKTLWEQTTENTKKVQNLTGNEVVFPFGTAVQNLSTIASLADIGDGAGMTADGGHLHEGLPCLTAAYANALTILREAGIEWKSIIGEGTRPTKEWCNAIGVPGTNYGATTNDVVGVTDANVYYAQVAAIQAVKQPYELTDISMIL